MDIEYVILGEKVTVRCTAPVFGCEAYREKVFVSPTA